MKKPLLLVLVLIYTLAGCSENVQNKSGGNAAAEVNGVEITKQEVNYIYERFAKPEMSARESANLKRNILSRLIREELLAEKAKEMQLDKSTDFAMERYHAEKQALASLAEKELLRNKKTISSQEIDAFVQNNPELFAKRKLYIYEGVQIQNPDKALLESFQVMIRRGATLEEIVEELNAKKIPSGRNLFTLPFEQIPVPLTKVLNEMTPGVPHLLVYKNNICIITVLHQIYPLPLEGLAAKRAARAMISSYRLKVLMNKRMKELIDTAKIKYYDQYSQTALNNQELAYLPTPDTSMAEKRIYKQGALSGVFFLSLVIAMMVLTAGMRVLTATPWLPRLWWKNKENKHPEPDYERYHVRYVAPVAQRIFLYLLFAVVLFAVFNEILVLLPVLSKWILFGTMLSGILAGVLAGRIFMIEFFLQWSEKRYMIFATLLTGTVLVSAVLNLYFRNLLA